VAVEDVLPVSAAFVSLLLLNVPAAPVEDIP
jgi:hypothetical protein